MRRLSLLLLAVIVSHCLLFVRAEDEASPSPDSDVVILNDENFEDLTNAGSWIVEFYAPWCGHCKTLKPHFAAAASKMHGRVNFGAIDCTANSLCASKFSVKSYPTLKFFRDGKHRPYKMERTVQGLSKYAESMTQPPVQTVSDAKALKSLTDEVVLLFVDDGKHAQSSAARKAFDAVASELQGGAVRFVSSDSAKLREKYAAATQGPAVVQLCDSCEEPPFTGPWKFAADDLMASDIGKWTTEHKLPLVSEIDGANFEDVTQSGKIVVLAALDPAQSASKTLEKYLKAAAQKFRQFNFATVDGVKYTKYVAQFGLTPEVLPSLFAMNYTAETFYTLDPPKRFTTEPQVTLFLQDVVSGKLQPKATSAWYSPGRWFKAAEKWASGFTETQIAFGVFGVVAVFVVLIVAGCYYSLEDEAAAPPAVGVTPSSAASKGQGAKATTGKLVESDSGIGLGLKSKKAQ